MLGVLSDFLCSPFRAELWVTEGHHTGIIVGHPIYSASSKSPYDSQKTILTAYLPVPTEWIATEGNAGDGREEVMIELLAFNSLNKHCHAFIVVKKSLLPAI